MKRYDVIVVGGGPSAAFYGIEHVKLGSSKKVLIIEQGKRVEERHCPVEEMGQCIKCKPTCSITTGFSGAGAFSDGKLSLYNPEDNDIYVGGDLHKYIGVEETKRLIDYTDSIYLDFGADDRIEGISHKDEVQKIKKKAERANVTLINIPIRHIGTEKSHALYCRIQQYLLDNGVDIMFKTSVCDLIIKNNEVKGVKIKNTIDLNNDDAEVEEIYADKVIIAVGRKGANWLSDMCGKYNIETRTGPVDIGIRYELPDSVMHDINHYLYEGKFIARPAPFRDKVRTFCQNPSGYVSSEVYDEGVNLVNGHSYKERKSTNTNLAILVSHNFKYPFSKPIEYGRNIAKNLNELGNGNIVVQRLGDIYRGKRTWENELLSNSVRPTLKSAVAGDVTYALGYRTMTDILEFIRCLDKVIEGFADPDNLLYGPEIKFYSNRVQISNKFEASVKNLYCIGDGCGMTRGLMMASCSGVALARFLNA